ncbi:hypothetical protein QTO34_019037 [Cnephaeus nilssonii]|uniref:Uncharacterized protein n=1 Tax=Cnephaeus nilssonii TaxID=3371016 RepID=A0AA40I0X0_CNENI|nr:hypothetical protein QTO34_019037 [Eptesicus nilssonii]
MAGERSGGGGSLSRLHLEELEELSPRDPKRKSNNSSCAGQGRELESGPDLTKRPGGILAAKLVPEDQEPADAGAPGFKPGRRKGVGTATGASAREKTAADHSPRRRKRDRVCEPGPNKAKLRNPSGRRGRLATRSTARTPGIGQLASPPARPCRRPQPCDESGPSRTELDQAGAMLLTVYCVRRDLSEVTFSLQVDADFELHNFRALCELESGIPAPRARSTFGITFYPKPY